MARKHGKKLFINRELSWLAFNRRVLELARDKNVPLGEQLRFASIYASNLDEFFMVRVGALYDQTLLHVETKENKTKMTPRQQIVSVMKMLRKIQIVCDKNVDRLFKKLKKHNIKKLQIAQLKKPQLKEWREYFRKEILPLLSPQIVDERHSFPFLASGEVYVAFFLETEQQAEVFGLVPVPPQLERLLVRWQDEVRCFVLAEELVLYFIQDLFKGAAVTEACLFRVTRNAEINTEEALFDHDIDYRVVMSELLKKRRKLAAVRLQFFEKASEEMQDYLCQKLLLPMRQVVVQDAPLELSFLQRVAKWLEEKKCPEAFYPIIKPVAPPKGYNLYKQVQKKDVLMCFPHQSMRPFIDMLFEAARDPQVTVIKMTLYRVAPESKVVEALIEAAENGKHVVAIVELRARFDEQNNINWSRALQQAGCRVIYGILGYKIHSKMAQIKRETAQGSAYITQIGTGNYNEKTSEQYMDLSYVTSKAAIGREVEQVFRNLEEGKLTTKCEHLIVAPLHFKKVLLREMETEIEYTRKGGAGRVIVKCNSLSDKNIIEFLSEASVQGVEIDLIVRGICCLRAGVEGLTDKIQVHSIIGRYLEHARIYTFGEGERLRIYIASGDFLTRNTERRVEVGVRIEEAEIQKKLWGILQLQLADTVNTHSMLPTGEYVKQNHKKGQEPVDCQMELYRYLEKF